MNTPWGPSQHQETKAPGIISVSTAGHGGYRLSPERMMEIERRFPTFIPFAGACWLEEDCDWAFAAVTWPELWSERTVYFAVETILKSYDGRHASELRENCRVAMKIHQRFSEELEESHASNPGKAPS